MGYEEARLWKRRKPIGILIQKMGSSAMHVRSSERDRYVSCANDVHSNVL